MRSSLNKPTEREERERQANHNSDEEQPRRGAERTVERVATDREHQDHGNRTVANAHRLLERVQTGRLMLISCTLGHADRRCKKDASPSWPDVHETTRSSLRTSVRDATPNARSFRPITRHARISEVTHRAVPPAMNAITTMSHSGR